MGCGVCLWFALLVSIIDLALSVSLRCGVWVLLLFGCCVHCLRCVVLVVCGVCELLCVTVVM